MLVVSFVGQQIVNPLEVEFDAARSVFHDRARVGVEFVIVCARTYFGQALDEIGATALQNSYA